MRSTLHRILDDQSFELRASVADTGKNAITRTIATSLAGALMKAYSSRKFIEAMRSPMGFGGVLKKHGAGRKVMAEIQNLKAGLNPAAAGSSSL
ncbi:hypothetical protein AUF78_13445 [archaeon 13_1_20CM_2_51_12]|nr:MAG: hypothetical protein AUF78_13445 [archaeon 13_1_20CM_2_51_12]